jgi:hypothetical protein
MLDTVDDMYYLWCVGDLLIMVIYVDDLLLIGPPARIDRHIDLLAGRVGPGRELKFDIGSRSALGRYLGTAYIQEAIQGGTRLRAHLVDYSKALCVQFLSVIDKTAFKRATTPMCKEAPPEDEFNLPGRLESHAPAFLGALLWVVRCSRPEMAHAVGHIARFVSKWSLAMDRLLERTLAYLSGTIDYGLYMWTYRGEELHAYGFAVTDHAGCIDTGRSTNGCLSFVCSQR